VKESDQQAHCRAPHDNDLVVVGCSAVGPPGGAQTLATKFRTGAAGGPP
jgi:hypothetical protein